VSTALTKNESLAYGDLKLVIRDGAETFMRVGAALTQVRDKRLYREEYGTFEEFCQAEYGWTRQRAAQLIGASEVVESLSTTVDTLPTNEAQARELAPVPAEKRAEVWEKAVESAPKGKKPTAKDVRRAAAPHKPKRSETATPLAFRSWAQSRAIEAREIIASLPASDRQRAVDLVEQPGIPDRLGLKMLKNVAEADAEERERLLTLHDSDDPRDQALAKTEAVGQPPNGDPRCTILDEARVVTRRALKLCDRDSGGSFRERIEKVVADLHTLSEDIHAATRSGAA
jgi:hypothetical protein